MFHIQIIIYKHVRTHIQPRTYVHNNKQIPAHYTTRQVHTLLSPLRSGLAVLRLARNDGRRCVHDASVSPARGDADADDEAEMEVAMDANGAS